MTTEDEQSLAKRPEITPGPLVVGSMESVSGSLMNMAGFALERITRERTEVPPQFKLPERPVYFLDPNTRRMVMVSNRESWGLPAWCTGLFAETVELDDEGRPRFQLSTKEVLLPDENFVPVAVGPNEFKMPPSHIEMIEVEESGKERFVPWNVYLGSLQAWMNEVNIVEGESFKDFMKRFSTLQEESRQAANQKIARTFPGGSQGFAETTAPYNYILSDEVNQEKYERASRDAGFYPVFINVRNLVQFEYERYSASDKFMLYQNPEVYYQMIRFLHPSWGGEALQYHPTLITNDYTATWRLGDRDPEFVKKIGGSPYHHVGKAISAIMTHNPIFSYVFLGVPEEGRVRKEDHGDYFCPQNEQIYREFLYKVKADLLLTMFVRGGAPLVK